MPAERPVLLVEHGVKRLPTGGPMLTDVALSVAAGSSLAILGRSGSGKSTLLGILGLMDRLDSGTYELDGQPVHRLGPVAADRARATTLGFVFQRFCLIPHLTALENVEAPLLHQPGASRRGRRRRAADLLEQIGLGEHARKRPAQLSGGEQQRVAIARALVGRPRVVLADEPTGSLDTATADVVLDLLLDQVGRHGVTLVMVTHDSQVAARADRTVHLRDGALRGRAER